MKQYLDSLRHIVRTGHLKGDRTGTGTKSVFGYQERYDLKESFPIITHRKVSVRSIFGELVWFLSGSTNIEDLKNLGSTVWDEWADRTGSIGPIYGSTWRGKAPYKIDQIAEVLKLLNDDPNSRRIIIDSWYPEQLPLAKTKPSDNPPLGHMALAPCHMMCQFYVDENAMLSCQLYLRSSDTLLGKPYNIACYAALVHILCALTGYRPGELVVTTGDMHIYNNHIVDGALTKILAAETFDLPTMDITDAFEEGAILIDKLDSDADVSVYSDILNKYFVENPKDTLDKLVNGLSKYQSGPAIKMKVSV